MIITRLLLIFPIAVTAWADSNSSWFFFVKINDTFLPLSGSHLDMWNEDLNMFTYGDPSNTPVEFIREPNRIYTKYHPYPKYVGFRSNDMMFGTYIFPVPLNIDKRGRVLNGPFYSCDFQYFPWRGIVRSYSPALASSCFEVEIYFFLFDRETGSVVNPVPPGSPWSFFAKVNDIFKPLSGMYVGDKDHNFSLFIYGDPSEVPAEFSFKNGLAYTTRRFEAVGFYKGDLVFGDCIHPTRLSVDKKGRVLNGSFNSCDLSEWREGSVRVRGILGSFPTKFEPHCFDLDIYLLPYDKEIKSAVQTIFVEDQGKSLAKYDESDNSIEEPCEIDFRGSYKAFDDFLRYYNGNCTVHHKRNTFVGD